MVCPQLKPLVKRGGSVGKAPSRASAWTLVFAQYKSSVVERMHVATCQPMNTHSLPFLTLGVNNPVTTADTVCLLLCPALVSHQ